MQGTLSFSHRRGDASSRLLADCEALGRLIAGEPASAASRLEDELGSELAARLVAALRPRHRRQRGSAA